MALYSWRLTARLTSPNLLHWETFSDPTCPGKVCQHGALFLGHGTLTDVVVGGTGIFEGSTGALTGTVRTAISEARPADAAVVKLSGTIQYDP